MPLIKKKKYMCQSCNEGILFILQFLDTLHFFCIYPRIYVWSAGLSGWMTNTLHELKQTSLCWSWPWHLKCQLTSQPESGCQTSPANFPHSRTGRLAGWLAPCLHHLQHASMPVCQHTSHSHHMIQTGGESNWQTWLLWRVVTELPTGYYRVIYFPPATMLPARFKALSKVEILHLLARSCMKLHIFCTSFQTSS